MSDLLIRRLREENETQREYIRQLEEALAPDTPLPRAWKMSKSQSRFLWALRNAAPDFLKRERGMLAVYRSSDEFPATRSLDNQLRFIRRNFREIGVPITFESFKGIGWRMPPESCAIFDDAVAADQARWPAMGRAA